MNHNRRRRKQRPNYGRRMVEVCRSINGFGFTISGQQPCILSCIVPNSPADNAGLSSGDFLISVNGLNVSKMPHELVVQLINKTIGTICLTIAENYFSDSSEDEAWQKTGNTPVNGSAKTRRPKYPHHKLRGNKLQSGDKNLSKISQSTEAMDLLNGNNEHTFENGDDATTSKTTTAHNIIHSPNASKAKDISNVSAMVPPVNRIENDENLMQLEYRAVVGYLGTIEMPKQIATSSKLQTVRSCIRKMRQEKRQPTIVLMQILPNCLKLYNLENALIAKYPSNRLVYVSSNNLGSALSASSYVENDTRFFGLVTSSASHGDASNREWLSTATNADNIISNSCHVFVIDMKLIEHATHFQRAEHFSIVCTNDPISNGCLEFPSSSEYVVNLIRSMYSLNGPLAFDQRTAHKRFDMPLFRQPQLRHQDNNGGNSPQPSNASEVTTASSNSDSGIGFHNDFTNISDRIVVVDFPGVPGAYNHHHYHPHQHLFMHRSNINISPRGNGRPMPFGVDPIRNIRSTDYHNQPSGSGQCGSGAVTPAHAKSKSLDLTGASSRLEPEFEFVPNKPDLRLIRAMPDPQTMPSNEILDKVVTSPARYETIYGDDLKENSIEFTEESPKADDFYPMAEETNATHHRAAIQLNDQKQSRERLITTRSCDNLMINTKPFNCRRQLQSSFDDVSLLGEAPPPPIIARKTRASMSQTNDDHLFVAPQPPPIKTKGRRSLLGKLTQTDKTDKNDQLLTYKLSPKVFGVTKPSTTTTAVIEAAAPPPKVTNKKNPTNKEKRDRRNSTPLMNFSVWGSLQSLPTVSAMARGHDIPKKEKKKHLEPAFSEPDLTVSKFLLH